VGLNPRSFADSRFHFSKKAILHVASLAEKLFTLTCLEVVKAFGDSAQLHKLSRQITLLDRQLRPNR
jgi:hypothetical protein